MHSIENFVNRACKHFLELMISVGNPIGSKTILKKLIDSYSEPHRHYHTLEHIVSMLDDFNLAVRFAKDVNAVRLAIWYHDVIYDVSNYSADMSNEKRSSLYAREDLTTLGIPPERIETVCRLIELTAHQKDSRTLSVDEKLLLDLDLAVLGKSSFIFDAYEANIRSEYALVPDGVYREGRKKILSVFLARNPLYLTSFFGSMHEQSAKKNLISSLSKL